MTYADMVEVEFKRIYAELNIAEAPERRKPDMIDSIWSDIYKLLFKPGIDDVRYNNVKSKIKTYDVETIESIADVFIKLNKRYGGVIKYNQFANLTGIHRYTLDLWHNANNTSGYIFNLPDNAVQEEYNNIIYIPNGNDVIVYKGNERYIREKINGVLSVTRFDVKKKLQEEMQDSNTNGTSIDTMGQMFRANNEQDLGRLYEPRKTLMEVQARHMLTDGELIKLGQIAQKENVCLLENAGESIYGASGD